MFLKAPHIFHYYPLMCSYIKIPQCINSIQHLFCVLVHYACPWTETSYHRLVRASTCTPIDIFGCCPLGI